MESHYLPGETRVCHLDPLLSWCDSWFGVNWRHLKLSRRRLKCEQRTQAVPRSWWAHWTLIAAFVLCLRARAPIVVELVPCAHGLYHVACQIGMHSWRGQIPRVRKTRNIGKPVKEIQKGTPWRCWNIHHEWGDSCLSQKAFELVLSFKTTTMMRHFCCPTLNGSTKHYLLPSTHQWP